MKQLLISLLLIEFICACNCNEHTRPASTPRLIPESDITAKAVDYSGIISGRFILAESGCAGFDFINKNIVLWTNEIACFDPDTLRLRWLGNTTFMTKSIKRINENCPPRINIYEVVSFNGTNLVLNSISTNWSDSEDSKLEFTRQSR